jgi:uncharacterized membrane protein
MLNALLTSMAVVSVAVALVAWLAGVVSLVRLLGMRVSQPSSTELNAHQSAIRQRIARGRTIKAMVVFVLALAAAGTATVIRNFVVGQ